MVDHSTDHYVRSDDESQSNQCVPPHSVRRLSLPLKQLNRSSKLTQRGLRNAQLSLDD